MATQTEEYVHIDKLKDNETFLVWKFQVTIVFKSLGLYDIVSEKKVLRQDSNKQEKEDWLEKDARVQKIIVSTLDKQPLTHVLICNTSKEMFQKICFVYERDTEQQKCLCL